tara:strand:+ start:2088 stop:3026 length:939 start_codon:yes stop_codon:yes gene_type:complete
MKKFSKTEKETRNIYLRQHKNFAKDNKHFNRFLNVCKKPEYYGLTKKFFRNKNILDSGCGNTGYIQVAMYKLGASSVTCLDIGTGYINELKKLSKKFKMPKDFLKFKSGSTTNIPFKKNTFDLVISHGVIIHLANVKLAKRAIQELGRVTKKGGMLFINSGVDSPGIIEKFVTPAFRKAYLLDKNFKKFIDTISPKVIKREIEKIYKQAHKYDKSLTKKTLKNIDKLINLDTCTFIQNHLQVKNRYCEQMDEKWTSKEMSKAKFHNIKRIREFYHTRYDFRKYLSPFHFFKKNNISNVFYGNGHVKLIGKKK